MSQSPFTPEQIAQLERPLDPRRVKHRSGGGGVQLAYLKGHDVINTANHIFGYGNWGYDLLGVELNNVSAENGEVVGSYYIARVKLTVVGCVPITEEGVCPVQEGRNPRARIDAHDMARKGAITDALKRVLRCYGDQFGNSLYDTDLVDGQPRNNGASRANNNNNTTSRPAAPTAHPANPPSRAEQEPTPVAPLASTNNSTPRPVAASVNGASADSATEQQRQAIRKLATRQEMSVVELEAQAQELFGRGLETISKSEASHFIKVLQGAAA